MIYLLLFILLLSFYVIINLYRKLRRAEKLIIEGEFRMKQEYVEFYKIFNSIYSNIIAIDKKGSFKSEDQVGIAWKLYVDLHTQVENLFKITIQD